MQPGHDGSDRHAEQVRDLAVRVTLDVCEIDRRLVAVRQLGNCLPDVGEREPAEHLGLGRRGHARPVGHHARGERVEFGAQHVDRLALTLAVAIDERVRQDAEQPGPRVRARREVPQSGIRAGHALLDQVLGVAGISRHPKSGRIQVLLAAGQLTFEDQMVLTFLRANSHRVVPPFSLRRRSSGYVLRL